MPDIKGEGRDESRTNKEGVSFTRLVNENKGGVDDPASSGWNGLSRSLGTDAASVSSDDGSGLPAEDNTDVEEFKSLYGEALDYLDHVYDLVGAGEEFSLEKGEAIIDRIVEIGPDQDTLYVLALHKDYRERYLSSHAVNVAIFSIRLAENLGFDKNRMKELGLAALLHDVGTARIADDIIYKKGGLTKKEMGILRQRPVYGHEILKRFGGTYRMLYETALQVYERIDGSGYPHGLRDDEINEYARIIGLVDVYEAMIHSRPQRERFLHFSAIKEIIKTGKEKFARRYLKALVNIFSIFPLYSYIKLNSGAIGRVIGTHPDHPLRPKLTILYDSRRKALHTERIVDLPDHPLLNIVDSFEAGELEAAGG
ncbi:MAG: HD domain-containing protein [Deltaproteobacteria bacterium]|nr:HD domain-containing protein [Deltaproteobacteria bacterium]